jgi:predicted nucleotidyltransferase
MRHPPTPDVLRRAVETAVAGEDDVVAAYIFGSSVQDAAGPLSDVDVAVLTNGSPADEDAIVDRVADRLERTLRVPRVDVVALSRAALPLRYRVIRDGTLIVSRDAARLERFSVESTLHYLDFAPIRERAFRIQRAAILAHGR